MIDRDVRPGRKIRRPDAVYIHIPFCRKKCYYCDFNTYTVDGQPVDAYLEALDKEMARTVALVPPAAIDTVYVGGGTPTILEPERMAVFLRSVRRHFPVLTADCEFTVEANPGTANADKLSVMAEHGVNRISFGAQTFDRKLLRAIGRSHDVTDIYRSIELARNAGIDNLSIDLMFGLPGQTTEMMEESLERALELELPHYSLYSLKIEENTLFHALYERGELGLPDEETELEMYEMIIDKMKRAGYVHYEISNFARPGFASRHNQKYWKNESYYGFGAGAHGYVNGVRHVNIKGVSAYIEAVGTGLPVKERFAVPDEMAMEDFMIVGLRLLDGVDPARFLDIFGIPLERIFEKPLKKLISLQLLEQADGRYRLTHQGLLLGNEVFAEFLLDR